MSGTEPNKEKKACFVVGPIGEAGHETRRQADWLLHGVIKPVFRAFPAFAEPIRSDEITIPGMIDSQMINHLLEADLVIADMSDRNPNAFYEMGIRHMASKPIIHMFRVGTQIPFDVGPYRAIPFLLDWIEGLEKAKADLAAAVTETLRPNYRVENPVTRARGIVQFEQRATPEMRLIRDDVETLRAELAASRRLPIIRNTHVPKDIAKVEFAPDAPPLAYADVIHLAGKANVIVLGGTEASMLFEFPELLSPSEKTEITEKFAAVKGVKGVEVGGARDFLSQEVLKLLT